MLNTRILLHGVTLLLVVLAFGASAKAQGVPAVTAPAAVVNASSDCATKLDFKCYADYFHPAELEKFKQILWPAFVQMAKADTASLKGPFPTLLGLQRTDSGLVDMPAAQFFANLLNALSQMSPEIKDGFANMKGQVVGEVPEGDSTVHVVIRFATASNGIQLTQMEVVTVIKYGKEWRLALSGKMEGLAFSIRQQMTKRPGKNG
jgi:hypothetical protein